MVDLSRLKRARLSEILFWHASDVWWPATVRNNE
jgi:hypothetical protein